MKKVSWLLLGIIFASHLTNQIMDYIEIKRYVDCTLETNDYDKCSDGTSSLYKFLLKTEIPRLSECVLSGRPSNILCEIFKIERSK